MTLETFFEKFDQLADAPNAVTKMRGLILRLAMQGKLSESHKSDGSVSELLGEVEKDRARLGLADSANASGGNSDSLDDETADAIPARWRWMRFGSIARHNAGKTLDKGRNRGELREYVTTSNLYWGSFQLDAVRQMPISDDELDRCTAIKGDLLICEGGEAGRAAVWPHDREISFQNHVHRARFFAEINPYFVQRYFEKLNATGEIEKYRKGVGISNMSGKALASIPIPLPPLAEQRRIVAKVDELMLLCDRLEAQQQERDTQHDALAHASLARFSDAPTPANLNFLFHGSYSIDPADLRKTILTLAVQGKLVPQDPNDEPAAELIARLANEMSHENRRRQAAPLPPLSVDSLQYELPESWTWARFRDVAIIASNLVKPNDFLDLPHLAPDNIEKGNGVLKPCSTVREDKIISSKHRFYSGQIVYSKIRPNLAKVVIANFDGLCSADMYPIDALIEANYLHLYMLSESFLVQAVKSDTRVAMPKINQTELNAIAVPVPPLAEQRRIVAQVDELIALVDVLETQLATARTIAEKLMEAVVAELTTGLAYAR
ncbi:MAG: restriction endonuclease subunit S [Nitrospira sp.]|nr:restriction endonuclease subunit S [Nitrospira sp.]